MNERQPLLNGNNSHPSHTTGNDDVVIVVVNEGSCCPALRSEFKCQHFGFSYSREDVFYSCQWDWPPIIFVLYRIVVAVYAFTVLVLSIVYSSDVLKKYPWPVWLTNWSFLMLTIYLLVSAAVVVFYSIGRGHCCQRWSLRSSVYSFLPGSDMSTSAIPPNPLPIIIKLQWLLFDIAAPAAFIVTVVFFSALYPQMDPQGGLDFGNATLHMSNSLLVVMELALCAIPIRMMHAVYLMIYGIIYTIFSVIFWAFNNTNVLYPHVLDWNHPGMTCAVILPLLNVGVPLIQLAFYMLYKLRVYIYNWIYGTSAY